jgi:hypothetical protein
VGAGEAEGCVSSPQKVAFGLFTIQENQNVMDIAQIVYGDPKRLNWILDANPTADFVPGEKVVIPNKKGTLLTAQEDDGIVSLFQRDLPGKAISQYLDLIRKWNGGYNVDVSVGELIFVPDRQAIGY